MPTTQYPLLMQYARNPDALALALRRIEEGEQSAFIKNVHYQEAKNTLNRAFERAWDELVMKTHVFRQGRAENDPVLDAIYQVNIFSLRDAIAASKRVSRLDASHPAAAAATAVLAEAHPLAERMTSLKDHIVKRNQERIEPPPPANPNKMMGTCSCCFRGIAVLQTTGRMAHHGYRRPMERLQTASCPGIRFKPLEESTEGLEWMIGVYVNRVAEIRRRLAAAPTETQLTIRRAGQKDMLIKQGDEGWPKAHAAHISGLGREERTTQNALEYLRGELNKWEVRLHQSLSSPKKPRRPRPRG